MDNEFLLSLKDNDLYSYKIMYYPAKQSVNRSCFSAKWMNGGERQIKNFKYDECGDIAKSKIKFIDEF